MVEQFTSPGWYPDPDGAAGERWWNGAGWSDTRRGGPAQVPVPPAAARVPAAPPVPPVPAPATSSPAAPQRPNPYAPPAAAPTTTATPNPNRPAVVGLVLGLVSLFFLNILAPVAIGFSIAGLNRAKVLKAAGVAAHSTALAMIGLVSGLLAFVIGVVTFVIGIVSVFSTDYYSYDLWNVLSGSLLSRLF